MGQNAVEVYEVETNKTRVYNLENSKDVLRYAARQRFAWPGGYELLVDFPEGITLCSSCIRERYRAELGNLEPEDRLFLYGAQEIDPNTVFCEHCGKDCSAHAFEVETTTC